MELKKTIRRLLMEYMEYYDKDKLYHRDSLIKQLMSKDSNGRYIAPRQIREYVKDLPMIDCYSKDNKKHICTKIPNILYVYLNGKY